MGKKKSFFYRCLKLGILSLVFLGVMELVKYAFHRFPLEIFRISELSIEDVDFTDITYQTGSQSVLNKNIVLINMSTIAGPKFRAKLVDLVDKIELLNPKVIGLDLSFVERKDIAANTDTLLNAILTRKKVVFGVERGMNSIFPFDKSAHANPGYINFPGKPRETVREYYNHCKTRYGEKDTILRSFACELFNVGYGIDRPLSHDSLFMIRFSGSEKGFYDALHASDSGDINNDVIPDTTHDFPAIDATAILSGEYPDSSLVSSVKDKAVIIGWLGLPGINNEYDLHDKHRVPCDLRLFNRAPAMPGAVIHANALQMLIDKYKIHKVGGFMNTVLLFMIVFLYLFIYLAIEDQSWAGFVKIILEKVLGILTLIIFVLVSLKLMKFRIHINVGEMLVYLLFLSEYKSFVFAIREWYYERKKRKSVDQKK